MTLGFVVQLDEMSGPIVLALVVGSAVLVVAWAVRADRRRPQENELEQALRLFDRRREALQAEFFRIAAAIGKPRGLVWTRTDWKRDIAYARDLESGLLTAFVGVEISFAAIPGGEMEDVEAVGQVRQAAAVFHYRDGRWGTGGKALFNFTPKQAVERLHGQYEPVDFPDMNGSSPMDKPL